jgi:hypothetical protein
MGFFDDLAMGFGFKPKTKDFEARTARTMERNQNQRGADQYRESRGVTNADIGNMAQSSLSGYQSLLDRADGGGPGRSGARFSSADTGAFAGPLGSYVSEQMYLDAEKNQPEAFARTQGGIASLSNKMGFRPLGSYDQERNLGAAGINIGTSGIADYLAGAGMIGNIVRGGAPSSKQRVEPNVPLGHNLDPSAVQFFNEEAQEAPSLMEKLFMSTGDASASPTIPNYGPDREQPVRDVAVVDPEGPEDPITRIPAIHIAPIRMAQGGLMSLRRR